MSSEELEVEETLIFADQHVEQVLDVLWPASGLIDAGDVTLQLDTVRIKRQAHLYVGGQSSTLRARLKVRMGKNGIGLKRQEKALEDDGNRTIADSGWICGPDIYNQPETWQNITAAFLKDRVSLCYRCKGRPKVDISIDRLSPLHPSTMDRLPCTLWYCEIEGAAWVPPARDVPISADFWSRLTAFASVAVEGQAKWEMVRASSAREDPSHPTPRFRHWIDAVANALLEDTLSEADTEPGDDSRAGAAPTPS